MALPPANAFLAALLHSPWLDRISSPTTDYRLLVPTIDSLTNAIDRETGTPYSELVDNEDFLASHVIRLFDPRPRSTLSVVNGRDAKTKVKQFTTLNGRSVLVKDNSIFTNQGFKNLAQAHILSDAIYFSDTHSNSKWLVYYISRPLLGTHQPASIQPATPAGEKLVANSTGTGPSASTIQHDDPIEQARVLNALRELLYEYPMIVRQLGMTSAAIYETYSENLHRPEPVQTTRPSSLRSHSSSTSLHESIESLRQSLSGETARVSISSVSSEERVMQIALQAVIFHVIDALDQLDKQQFNILLTGTNTDKFGLEFAIERYITEHLHQDVLFPQLCAIRRQDDTYLESRLRRMANIDIAQVGITIEAGRSGKHQLSVRLGHAVGIFNRMSTSSSPRAMIDVLLATIKAVTSTTTDAPNKDTHNEKISQTMDADSLVSMLLLIVIRSSLKQLNARLSYMRHFVFIGEVDLGETGYALSTLEAVLAYLDSDSAPLRKASRTNARLWSAVRSADLPVLKSMLQQPSRLDQIESIGGPDETPSSDNDRNERDIALLDSAERTRPRNVPSVTDYVSVDGSLDHVFPFQKPPTPPPEHKHWKRKRVSMAETSSRSTSCHSSRRASTTSASSNTLMVDDISAERLAQTQNQKGDSLIFMAIDANQYTSLECLLGMEDLFPSEVVLQDTNLSGATMLIAAMQAGDHRVIDFVLRYVRRHLTSTASLSSYLAKQDGRGRCVFHFLGVYATLINDLGICVPWSQKDASGHTPLFDLCRTYDLLDYEMTIDLALTLATKAELNGVPLRGESHVDIKGNTLLHILNSAPLIARLLIDADMDVNARNDRHFTPLMTASKYGKHDAVAYLLTDSRVDVEARDIRGLSAIELAKDDIARRRLDHMVLFARRPDTNDHTPTIVRSFFVDDGSFRMIIESVTSSPENGIGSISCRRSLQDFEALLQWLALEMPASWLPAFGQDDLISPFAHPGKPSRAALMDTQQRFDRLLKLLLTHASFSTHELVWEFHLVPDLKPEQLAERSKRKAELRTEKIREDTEPISDVSDIESFVGHAQDQTRRLLAANRKVLRCSDRQMNRYSDLAHLASLSSTALSSLRFLPQTHKTAYELFTKTLHPSSTESLPLWSFHYDIDAIISATSAVSTALLRPQHLISRINATRRDTDKTLGNLSRSSRWMPKIGMFDESRRALHQEAESKVEQARVREEYLGAELRYTQQVVAAELAGWHEARVKIGREALRDLAVRSIVREKDRLAGMKRALRALRDQ